MLRPSWYSRPEAMAFLCSRTARERRDTVRSDGAEAGVRCG